MARLILFGCVLSAMLATGCDRLYAQDEQPSGTTQSEVGLSIVSMTVSPQARVTPGGVLIIRVIILNSAKQSASGYLVGHISGQSGEEDRRRVELAAGETKSIDIQLRIAKVLPAKKIEVVMTLNVIQGGREIMVQQGGLPVTRTLPLQVPQEAIVTALAMDDEPVEQIYWRWPPTKLYSTYELALATRVDSELSRQCMVLESEPLPLNQADWKCINTLIIANPLVFDDAANIAVMQQFLQSGGRIWIMLDSVDTDVIRDLLADDQQVETVATVALNRFEVEVVGHSFSAEDRTVDRDDAVSMKRVIQHGGRVTQMVDGWPAAIWMPVGRGELLLTTLSSIAWLTPRESQWSNDPSQQAPYTMPLWATAFANQLHSPKAEQALDMSAMTYPVDRIGNPVVSRSLVAFVLIAFCLGLIAFGIWRVIRGELNWVGVVAPALALAASVPLVVAAALQRRDIPEMVSTLQLVQIDSKTGAFLQESGAVYNSQSRAMDLIGKGDGLAIPSSKIETGVRSIVTDDLQDWRMSNAAWPAGTWRYTSEMSLPDKSMVAVAQLSEEGLTIDLPKDLQMPLEDVVVSLAAGAPSLGKYADDRQRFVVDGKLPAERERWTTDSIVTDEQRRRAAVYAKLFEGTGRLAFPQRTVFGWTEVWPQAPQWNNVELERRGTALVAIPVRMATPEVGSKVYIPYSLVRIEHAGEQSASSIFIQETGRFIAESTLSTEAELAFVLPAEVVPLEATSLAIDWDIKAPNRKARLVCITKGAPIELIALNEPSIPWSGTIDDTRVLEELRDGRIELRIEITGGQDVNNAQSGFVSWRIKHLRLSVDGRTLPRNSLVSSIQPQPEN